MTSNKITDDDLKMEFKYFIEDLSLDLLINLSIILRNKINSKLLNTSTF